MAYMPNDRQRLTIARSSAMPSPIVTNYKGILDDNSTGVFNGRFPSGPTLRKRMPISRVERSTIAGRFDEHQAN